MEKFFLNSEVIDNFRETINKYINYSMNQNYPCPKNYNAWSSICAAMDRIGDIVNYLNEKELNNGKYKACAFDFLEFISHAAVMIEMIDEIKKIYTIKPKVNNKRIFKDMYINEEIKRTYIENGIIDKKENDDMYFNYIRSLSAIHPGRTDRHKIYQEGKYEVSPYVLWNNGIYRLTNETRDLIIKSYSDTKDSFSNNKFIKISEVYDYIKYKYYSLNYVTKIVENKYEKQIEEFRKDKLKKKSKFGKFTDYLDYLIKIDSIRNTEFEYELKYLKRIWDFKLKNNFNQEDFDEYKKIIQYYLNSITRAIQNMDLEGNSIMDIYFSRILSGTIYINMPMGHYCIEKIQYLKDEYGDSEWGRTQFFNKIDFWNKYVDINKEEAEKYCDIELYLLAQIALFKHTIELGKIIVSDSII